MRSAESAAIPPLMDRLVAPCRLVRRGAALATWRGLARDGASHPTDRVRSGPACIRMGPGTTFDFEFTPTLPGELSLDVQVINATTGAPRGVTTLPVRVR